MSVDFQCVYPQELIPLNTIHTAPGMVPRTLDITGQDFRSVDQVLINGIVSPSTVILSKNRLLAQVPPQLALVTVTSVTVVATRLGLTKKSLISFQIGQTPSKVSGMLRLMQIFLKILFTTTGTDIFAPRVGGNGMKNLGLTFGADQGGNIVSNFIVSVNNTQRQVIAIQSRDPSIPPNERLLSATVTSAAYNRAEAALVVSVELVSQAGKAATANVVM